MLDLIKDIVLLLVCVMAAREVYMITRRPCGSSTYLKRPNQRCLNQIRQKIAAGRVVKQVSTKKSAHCKETKPADSFHTDLVLFISTIYKACRFKHPEERDRVKQRIADVGGPVCRQCRFKPTDRLSRSGCKSSSSNTLWVQLHVSVE